MKSGSSSHIKNAEFRFMKTAISYLNSPIDLENVHFADNERAIWASPGETVLRAENVTFENNAATSTIAF